MMQRMLLPATVAAGIAMAGGATQATPTYAQKEAKPCGFCHVNGVLGPAALYYKSHGYSLAGYAPDAAKPKKTGPPAYVSLWKMELAPGVTRIASGVLTDDKKPRLLALGADNKLKISNLTGKDPVDEATLDVGNGGVRMVVGRFAPGKPAVIAVPGAVWYRDGDKYVSKKIAKLVDVSGSLGFQDKTEAIFEMEGTDPRSWTVDLAATGDAVLKQGPKLVQPDEGLGVYSNVALRPGEDLLMMLGVPEEVRKIGVIGLIDPREEKKLFVWGARVTDAASSVVVVGIEAMSDLANAKPAWQSPKQPGKVLDVFAGPDPRGGKVAGLLVLSATGKEGKGRSLEFFALD